MVKSAGSVCAVLWAVVSEAARSSFVAVEMAVMARAGSYFGRGVVHVDPSEVSLHSSGVPEVHSSHSL